MQVTNLINTSMLNRFHLDCELGSGADGQVFSLLNDSGKVIKFGILFDDCSNTVDQQYDKLNQVLSYIKCKKTNLFVKVYQSDFLLKGTRSTSDGNQNYLIYYYLMDRLNKLSDDETKVFHTIISHEDRNVVKNYSYDRIQEMLRQMQRGLEFTLAKVNSFYNKLLNNKEILHLDIHPRNIMKDHCNNYYLIDLDRSQLQTTTKEK
jgi:serine/threonine protein kinase